MTLEQRLTDILEADASITSIVGTGDDTRVFWQFVPEHEALPAIVMRESGSEHLSTLSDTGHLALASHVIEINCLAITYAQAISLGSAVRTVLDQHQDPPGADRVHGAFLASETDITESPQDGSDIWTHRKTLDFEVWYSP